MIERFFNKHELALTDDDVAALTELFEMTDNELMDLLLGRKGLEGQQDYPAMRRVVQLIQES